MKRILTSDAESTYTNALVYGQPGTGKTYSARTLPGKTIIISAESGLKSLRDTDIEAWEVESWKDFEDAIDYLLKSNDETNRIDNIFVDSLTEMSKICIDHILEERISVYQARQKNMATIFKDQRTLEDYGIAKGRIDRTIRSFRDLRYNVLFSALSKIEKDQLRGTSKAMPMIDPSSMAESLPGIFDCVLHSRSDERDGEVIFWWETMNTEKWFAKDRSGNLDPQIPQDWNIILNAFKPTSKKGK